MLDLPVLAGDTTFAPPAVALFLGVGAGAEEGFKEDGTRRAGEATADADSPIFATLALDGPADVEVGLADDSDDDGAFF